MFIKDRQYIRDFIHDIQRRLCCYDMYPIRKEEKSIPDFCDCKYGSKDILHTHGEQTGCPEMRCLVELLSTMTDDEYNAIMKRAGAILT
jgi:hypothetical protein